MALKDKVLGALEPLPVAPKEDEFDPLAAKPDDPPPEDEGDDRAVAGQTDG